MDEQHPADIWVGVRVLAVHSFASIAVRVRFFVGSLKPVFKANIGFFMAAQDEKSFRLAEGQSGWRIPTILLEKSHKAEIISGNNAKIRHETALMGLAH